METIKFIAKLVGVFFIVFMLMFLGYVVGQKDKAQRIYQGSRIYIKYVDTCASYNIEQKTIFKRGLKANWKP